MGRPDKKTAKKKKPRDERAETEQYIAFLEKRLASANYKANVTAEEYARTKKKLEKARLVLKIMKGPEKRK